MRREIESRPLILLAGALIVGLTAVEHPMNLVFLAVGLWLFRDLKSWAIGAAGLFLGLVLAVGPRQMVVEPLYMEGVATIDSIPHEVAGKSYARTSISGLDLRLDCPASMDIHRGDKWLVKGVARPLGEIAAKVVGEEGSLSVSGGTRVAAGPAIFGWADGLRRGFEAFAATDLPPDEAAWMDRLCFRSGSLPMEDQADIDASGAGYLVAASGLQVYVLAGLVMGALTGLRVPRAAGLGVLVIVLAAYCLATGAHLSTVRAVVACLVFASAYLLRREPDLLSALALAAVGFLLVSPESVYSLGFCLSVVVISALGLFLRRGTEKDLGWQRRLLSLAVQGLRAAVIVILAGQPIMAWYSGRFSFGAVPANLLSVVVAPFAVGLGFLGYAVSLVSRVLGAGILGLAAPLADYLRVVTHWVGASALGFDVPAFSVWWLVVYYGLWLAVWRPRAVMA